ncbi:MAG: TraB/GumN family protein [Muribaculaceae bacterium]|nr:TraB/GumN family protein [Muribaculaceae bacterium]
MKKILSLALLAVMAFASSVSAQILWKVEKPGTDHVTYILGTHHFAPLSVLDSLANLPSALKNADKVYGELDMAAMTAPASMMAMQQALMAPADSTLDKVLTPAQLETVKAALDPMTGGQLPLEALYPMKPAALSTQIAAMMAMQLFPDLNPMEGLDMTMQERAKALGKPVAGLETIDFQMDCLYGIPISEQAESLMKTVEDMEGEGRRAVELANAYLKHDLDAILKCTMEEESDPEDYERLIFSRNDNWVKQLTEEMPEASLLVVVGAGHLPGDRGVLEQLRKAGYTVTSAE